MLLISPTEFHRIAHNLLNFAVENAITAGPGKLQSIDVSFSRPNILLITYPGIVPRLDENSAAALGLIIAKTTLLNLNGTLSIAAEGPHRVVLRAEFSSQTPSK